MNDFGFSDDNVAPDLNSTDKAQLLYNEIEPFLNNLLSHPEIETIKWSNRVQQIQQFKQKLLDILNN